MRKVYLITLAFSLLINISTFAQINSPSGATVPFGSNTSYEYGMMPTNLPTSGSYGQSSTVASEYNEWKTNLIEACPNGQYRVKFDQASQTVSEGIGYGMLLAAYAADKDLFDGLWKYYQANSNANGFMNWKINGCSGVAGSNGASDADVDATMALIVAATQWPSSTNPNYTQDAITMINRVKNHEINQTNYTLENGDVWKPACRNPSYQPPGYFRVWKEFMAINGQNQDAFWDLCIQGTENLLTTNAHANTGLPSNWSNPDGQLNSSCSGSGTSSTGFGYDAIRAPWRVATAELWFGTSSLQTILNKQADFWISIGGAGSVSGERNQDGTGGPGDHNGTFVGMCGAASLGAANTSQRQNFVNAMYTENLSVQSAYNPGYFNNTLRLIGLFVQTGNFWNPLTAGTQCAKPDLGESKTICGATNGVLLNSGLTSANNRTFTWKRNGNTISGANNPTYKVTTTGTYTVIVDSIDCSKSADVEVLGNLPDIDLGEDVDLCIPSEIQLEAGVSGNGISYQWSKDGAVIDNETSSTLEVTTAGAYELSISASGCPDKSDEIIVTSSLPETEGDTRCGSGSVTLKVLSSGGPYEWYANPTGGSPLHTGADFTTNITQTTKYYVSDAGSFEQSFGPSSSNNNFSGPQNGGSIGIKITAEEAFSIVELKTLPYVYNCNPGDKITLTMEVLDENGVSQGTYVATSVDCQGVQSGTPFNTYYTMSFENDPIVIPSAGNYTIKPSAGNQLVWFGSGANYTAASYEIPGIVNITSDTRDDKDNSFPGIFDLVVSSGNSCDRAVVMAIEDCITGSANGGFATASAVEIYPNPVSNTLHISANEIESIDVMNEVGAVIFSTTETKDINMLSWENGLYIVRVKTKTGTTVQKVIKQ